MQSGNIDIIVRVQLIKSLINYRSKSLAKCLFINELRTCPGSVAGECRVALQSTAAQENTGKTAESRQTKQVHRLFCQVSSLSA